MDVVYAAASAHVGGPDELLVFVNIGSHWPANDPLVLRNPSLFTTDPRFGLRTSVPLPDPEPETTAPSGNGKRGPGRPPLPRDTEGKVIR